MVIAMSDRDTDFSASIENSVGPQNSATAQNSAITDSSRSTAEFRAFVSQPGGSAETPWNMRAPGRKVALLAVSVIVVAIVLAVVAIAIVNG
jgi:hypothetical protein